MYRPDMSSDVKSSIVVFLVALPLCLGIALASGAPLASGLIAGIIGGIVVGFLSHSEVSVSGPAAGLTVIVAGGILQLGSFETFTLAVILAGGLQIMFGLVKLGNIGDYFPTAVIKGMLAAIGLTLIIKQYPVALGVGATQQSGIVIISVLSLGIMLLWEKLATKGIKFFQLFPGALFAVISCILIDQVFHLVGGKDLVSLPASLFGEVRFPDVSRINYVVAQLALTIAVVASLETLLCIDAADKIDPAKRKTNKNRELLAQGFGNTLSGVLGGLPVTAVIVRTSTNIAAGSKTRYSAVFHGLWLLLCVLYVPHLLNLIPLATLACVLLLVGYKLTKPVFFLEMWKRGWQELVIFVGTIGMILATDLLKGIFAGVCIALIMEIKGAAVNCLEVTREEGKVHVKFIRNASFLHKARVAKILEEIKTEKKIAIHGLRQVRVHVDVHEVIQDFHMSGTQNNIEVEFI